jgi:hypothetical protein
MTGLRRAIATVACADAGAGAFHWPQSDGFVRGHSPGRLAGGRRDRGIPEIRAALPVYRYSRAVGKSKPTKPRAPKAKCCEDRPRCARCPIRMLKEGTLPAGFTVRKRRLVRL